MMGNTHGFNKLYQQESNASADIDPRPLNWGIKLAPARESSLQRISCSLEHARSIAKTCPSFAQPQHLRLEPSSSRCRRTIYYLYIGEMFWLITWPLIHRYIVFIIVDTSAS